jgi:hypothetical protein
MTKRSFFGAMAVVAAVALTGSALVASNMGFKLNYGLENDSDGGGPRTGQNTLALPDNRQSGLNTSIDLMNDIGFAATASVSRYIKATNGFELYTGRKGSPNANFNLASGEAYFVSMITPVSYIVVGSDDPAITYALTPDTDGAGPITGQNFFAYNYHQTAATSIPDERHRLRLHGERVALHQGLERLRAVHGPQGLPERRLPARSR